jgi:tetratricopeptide (TPR) repeat protein
MNKRCYLIILLLPSILNSLCAQNSTVRIDNKEITLLDNSYAYKDTTQKIFLKNNGAEVWNLRQEITKLHFDHCNHNEIEILIYCDATGEAKKAQLIIGTSLLKIDSTILELTKSHSKKFKPTLYNDTAMQSLNILKYKFHNKEMEEALAGNVLMNTNMSLSGGGGNYEVAEKLLEMKHKSNEIMGGQNKSDECADDTYFYDAGVKCFQQSDFSKAIYNFNQAVEANPWDYDAYYNLGLSYQKADKLKKACECFSKGVETGDFSAAKAHTKFCSEINNK